MYTFPLKNSQQCHQDVKMICKVMYSLVKQNVFC